MQTLMHLNVPLLSAFPNTEALTRALAVSLHTLLAFIKGARLGRCVFLSWHASLYIMFKAAWLLVKSYRKKS